MPFLENLTEFSEALVYGFDAELSLTESEPNSIHYTVHGGRQYQDVYEAYYYAQEQILPKIRTAGVKALTAKELLSWLNEIHARIGRTVAKDMGMEAGQYIKPGQEIARWHAGLDIQNYLAAYLALSPRQQNERHHIIKHILKTFPTVKIDELQAFLNLAEKYKPQSMMVYVQSGHDLGTTNLWHLLSICRAGVLNTQENAIIKKIVTLCMPASQVPAAMQAFAEKTIARWKACDPNDLKQTSKFLSETFFELAGTHPYCNANGRTATCLINIILRSFNKPSILLRNPLEKEDTHSAYSKAIDALNEGSSVLLADHILTRINDAEKGNDYHHDDLKNIVILRVKLKDAAVKLQMEFPRYDVNTPYDKHVKKEPIIPVSNQQVQDLLNQRIAFLEKKYEDLRLCANKAVMKNTLDFLTPEYKDWKTNTTDGFKVWHELSNAEADTLIKKFEKTKAFEMNKRPLKSAPGRCALMLSNINLDILLNELNKKLADQKSKIILTRSLQYF